MILLRKCGIRKAFGVKRDLADFTPQGLFSYCIFTIWFCPKSKIILGQTPLIYLGQSPLEFYAAGSVNIILVLLSFCPYLQGFQHKKRPCRISSTRSNFIFGFANGLCTKSNLFVAGQSTLAKNSYPPNPQSNPQ